MTKSYSSLMKKLLFAGLRVPAHRPHVAVTYFRSGQVSVRHSHDFFEVFLVISGSGVHHINGKSVNLTAGHLVVIQPSDSHHFSTQGEAGLAILNVAVSSGWWRSFHQLMGESIPADWFRAGEPVGHLTLTPGGLRGMRRAFEQLGGLESRPPSDVVEVLLQVIRRFESLGQTARPTPPAWLEKWREEMRCAGEEITEAIGFWQKRSGRSPEHLARSCRAFYECTPTNILNHHRIERAKMLLGSTDEKVISVGFACGFGNLANFYRNFTTRTGMTPKAWRQRGGAAVPLGQ
jgi:AraC family cel operon transcriptional repressor